MPIYEYQCEKCGHLFDAIQKYTDDALTDCPECDGSVSRLVSTPAIQFKGSGFYITDYQKSGGSGVASSASGPGSSDSGKKTTGKKAASKKAGGGKKTGST
ncbi:MAG: hypothetical protein OEY97_01775 [Nitrospirota bacterium]|nr:hypothetical protein [Nitrospirota bacterium]